MTLLGRLLLLRGVSGSVDDTSGGEVLAIEVKASATAKSEHFRGIDHLASRIGDDLTAGIVLYLGHETLPFGDRRIAMPLSAIWEL